MKEWALHYAKMGLAVFPLVCRDKVPAVVGGCKVATTERTTIERWWDKNPQYNIGIATGNKSSGLVVIDLDVDKNKGIDGYDVLRDWQNKHGKLPETWQSITGRGGYHYFYKDAIVHSNRVGLYEGVDIRGEGGYIVAPPSVHPNGNIYEWEQGTEEYEIAQVDNIVNDFLKGEKQRRDSEHKTNFKVPELIPEGKRVDTIVRLIASLRTKGLDDDVYEKYSQWCNDCGLGIDGRTSFYEELKTKNLLSKTGTVAGKTVKNVIKGYSFVDEIFHPVDGNSKVPFS